MTRSETDTPTAKLLRLIQENPELPVVPMVWYEVCGGDEYARWMGCFGEPEVLEYAIDEWSGGRVRYKDFGEEEDLIESIAIHKYDGSEEAYKKAETEAADLWTKAIIVGINLPE